MEKYKDDRGAPAPGYLDDGYAINCPNAERFSILFDYIVR